MSQIGLDTRDRWRNFLISAAAVIVFLLAATAFFWRMGYPWIGVVLLAFGALWARVILRDLRNPRAT